MRRRAQRAFLALITFRRGGLVVVFCFLLQLGRRRAQAEALRNLSKALNAGARAADRIKAEGMPGPERRAQILREELAA